jgi:hypothetical protein
MNRKDFRYNSYTIGEIVFNFKNISATGGKLYPRIFLPFELKFNKLDKIYNTEQKIPRFIVNAIKAELCIENSNEKLSDSLLVLNETTFYRDRTNSTNIRLEFPVDHNKIDRIEISRGKDVKLNLQFQFQVGLYEPINVLVDNNLSEIKYFITDYQIIHEDFDIEIPQSYWLKNVLPNLGVGEFFVIELPKGDNKIKEAWQYIETAEHAYRNWDSKSVFANCRELGTLLDGKIKDKFGKTSFAYLERWQRRYKNYNYFASLDLHLEDTKSKSNNYTLEEMKTYKADAENMILSAKILLKYAQELLNE